MSPLIALDATGAGTPLQGIGHYARDLARALGRDPGPFAFRLYLPSAALPALAHLEGPAMTLVGCDFDRRRGGRLGFQHFLLPPRLGRDGIDLLHSLGNTLPLGWRGQAVLTLHDLDFLEHPGCSSAARRLYFSLLTPRSLRRADRIVAISAWTAGSVRRHYPGIPPERVTVIHHGPPAPRQVSPAEIAAVRESHALDRPYFLALGSLELRKNLTGTVRAFEEFQRGGGRPALLVLAGEPGFGYERIREAVRSSPSRNDIRMTGYLPAGEVGPILAGAAGLLFLSAAEGFGLPALEAMAAGCPVVAARAAALPEICGNAALLVPADDPAEGAVAIRRLLEEPGLRERLVAAGHRRLASFSWEAHGAAIRGVYRQVLAG